MNSLTLGPVNLLNFREHILLTSMTAADAQNIMSIHRSLGKALGRFHFLTFFYHQSGVTRDFIILLIFDFVRNDDGSAFNTDPSLILG